MCIHRPFKIPVRPFPLEGAYSVFSDILKTADPKVFDLVLKQSSWNSVVPNGHILPWNNYFILSKMAGFRPKRRIIVVFLVQKWDVFIGRLDSVWLEVDVGEIIHRSERHLTISAAAATSAVPRRRWRRKRAGKRRDATATTLWCGRRGLFPIISRLWNVHDASGASMTPHVSSAGILSVKIGPFVRRDALRTENRRPPIVRNRSPTGWSENSRTFHYFSGVWNMILPEFSIFFQEYVSWFSFRKYKMHKISQKGAFVNNVMHFRHFWHPPPLKLSCNV